MKLLKRIFLVVVILFVLIIGALLAVPFVFKDELVEVVKEQINANINATTEFADVDVTVLRSFPHLTLALQEFSVTGKDEFADLRLVEAQEASVTVNIRSLMGGNQALEIREVALSQPKVHVVVREDGLANYDIALPAEETASEEESSAAGALQIALQDYSIEQGNIIYDDRAGDIYLEIQDLNHQGSGNLTLSEYDLDTETAIGAMTVEQGGVAFLKNARLALDAIFHINTEESLYQLRDNELRVNELLLNADGEVQMQEEDIRLDLSFNSPGSDFRSLWSLIPNAYTADYQDVDISGTFSLDGLVKGIYNESTYPAFRIKTSVKDGQVKYPDLPLGIKNIQADLDVNSPSSDLDQMLVKAENLALQVGNDPFNARFLVKTPISDPDVDASVDGVIDLAQWAQAFPVEGIQEMAGRIIADVNMKTRLSTLEREAYDQVQMAGEVQIEQLLYQGDGLPKVVIETASASFTPQRVEVADFTAQLGKSDIQASGQIDNILAYISPEKTMRGSFQAHTNYFLVDEWMPEEEETDDTYQPTTLGEEEAIFDRFDLALDATANRIVYDTYELTDAALKGQVKPNRIDIQNVRSNLGESDFSGSGTILHGFDYAFNDGVLGGDLQVNSGFFDLNPFMEEPEGGAASAEVGEEAYGVIPIPANIDMTMNAKVDRLRYTDMELKDIRGKMTIQDETVIIEDGSAKVLGGSMDFTGAYDTKDVTKPGYDFRFDLNQLNFKETFNTFNTFATFAPVGKLVDGQFSTSLLMSGELGSDMMPVLESVNAEGLFETLNGSLQGLQPLAAVGNALNISELKESVKLERLKTWFTIEDGTFEVEPFDVKLADLPMTISGRHGLTQNMSYTINTVIPRSKLGDGSLGTTINQGVSALVNQANQLGLNVNNAENLNVQIALTGNMADPKVGFKLLGADGESNLAEAATEEVKDLVADQVEEVKDQVTSEVDELKETVTDQTTALVDSAKDVARDQLQQAGQDLLNQATGGTTPKDSTATGTNLQNQTQEAIDKIKDDIKDFNPFRRKKKKEEGGGK
ncbi:MAG: AsmA-like C-terminal region-containing protein [Bacteroidota bacterium]